MASNCIDNLNYPESDKVKSPQDSAILWSASCGYYATTVQALADLASGLEASIQTDPTSDQTINGDFKLILDGLSFTTFIAPNELSIKSKQNGGLDILTDTNGITTVTSKGVPVQTYDEAGVNMLESLKMPVNYTSTAVNDVVVNSELTAVADDVAAVEQEVDAIQANYAKTDEENTFSEKQTLSNGAEVTGLINNTDAGIKHNAAIFVATIQDGSIISGILPSGWTVTANNVGLPDTFLVVSGFPEGATISAALQRFSDTDPCKSVQATNGFPSSSVSFFDVSGVRVGSASTNAQVIITAIW